MGQTNPKFTYVKIDVPERRYKPPLGLFFEYADGVSASAEQIVADPVVRELLGPMLAVTREDSGLLVHADTSLIPTPDKATPDDHVHVHHDGVLRKLRVLDRFSQCADPTRDLLGCSYCANKGAPCISGAVHGKPLFDAKRESDEKNSLNPKELKDNITKIAGHVYVSPVLLAEASEVFVSSDRYASDIDWSAETERREKRQSAAKLAALTREFKRTECGVCTAKAGGCERWRHCPGAYPPEQAIIEDVLKRWLPVLEATPAATGLQPWQLYAIMRHGGLRGESAYNRRRVLLGRLMPTSDLTHFEVCIAAYRRVSNPYHAATTDWKRLRKVFPRLPAKEGDPGTERPSDESLALYFGAVQARRFKPALRGFKGYQSDHIGHLSIRPQGGVWVERARYHGIREGTGSYMGAYISSWGRFYEVFGELPSKRRRTRPEVYYQD